MFLIIHVHILVNFRELFTRSRASPCWRPCSRVDSGSPTETWSVKKDVEKTVMELSLTRTEWKARSYEARIN